MDNLSFQANYRTSCLSEDEQKRNVAYMHNGSLTAFIMSDVTEGQCNQRILYEKKLFSIKKRKEILKGVTETNLEDTLLSDMSQEQKDKGLQSSHGL